ncbi:fungal chitosanase of glycosyl hydrolase group 75-domain-containing protein [Favolaschia claudopus]|uniref:Endo-chitosanase n=2 Tax=Favolaschia claudopus TaxID=2862362 RepID=A0AAW0A8Y7_9AGAR
MLLSFSILVLKAVVCRALVANSLLSAADDGCNVEFAADPSVDVAGIYAALQAARSSVVATYPTTYLQDHTTSVYSDLLNLTQVSVIHFFSDMDVDCDGLNWDCEGNTDGDPLTSFGALDAEQVPWYVLPASLAVKEAILPNALGAIICNGNLFYAIFGDTNGASPEVIGEGSLLLGQTCFPDDEINGNNGHEALDVAYIVFPQEVPPGVQENSIDIEALKELGDQQILLLQQDLGISLQPNCSDP